MVKRICTMILGMIMILSLFPVSAFAGEDVTEDEVTVSYEEQTENGADIESESLSDIANENSASEEIGSNASYSDEKNDSVLQNEETYVDINEESIDDTIFEENINNTEQPQETDTSNTEEAAQIDLGTEIGSGDAKPEFHQNTKVDGVTISLDAEEGIFPADAILSVNEISENEQKKVESSLERLREDSAVVAAAYTFDIKVLDADGNELQPVDDQSVKVSFTTDKVTDQNLDISIYHIEDDNEVQQLAVKITDDIATAETDGFSYYTVEFTYNELQYVMQGDTTVDLADVLDFIGLSGEVTDVECSDTDLFFAFDEDGVWKVTALQAFTSEEWMKVTINGVEYEIVVTDAVTQKALWPLETVNLSQAPGGDYSHLGTLNFDVLGGNIFAPFDCKIVAKATCKITTRYYDVNDSSKYYYKPVYWAADKGITTGYDNVYFGPKKDCTRLEMITLLWRLQGKPKASGKTSFKDIEGKMNKNSDGYKAVLWGTKKGIIRGYETGTFTDWTVTGPSYSRNSHF